jgi:hypothetical protein
MIFKGSLSNNTSKSRFTTHSNLSFPKNQMEKGCNNKVNQYINTEVFCYRRRRNKTIIIINTPKILNLAEKSNIMID